MSDYWIPPDEEWIHVRARWEMRNYKPPEITAEMIGIYAGSDPDSLNEINNPHRVTWAQITTKETKMELILNSKLEEHPVQINPEAYKKGIERLVNSFMKSLSPGKMPRYNEPPPYVMLQHNLLEGNPEVVDKGFLAHLSHSYAYHRPIEIAPHDLWLIVLTELANAIKNQPDRCRKLFTRSDEKVAIVIPVDDPTSIDLNYLIEQLRSLVPVDIDKFVPELSTLDHKARVTLYAAFADGVQHYYDYMTLMCGIPKIRLLGTQEDWKKLILSASFIKGFFGSVEYTEVVQYMARVEEIFEQIYESYDRCDMEDFWRDIYTHKNVGSGQQLDISGWIKDLYMGNRGKRLENFLTSVAIVPYKNLDTGKEFKGVYGGFQRLVTEDRFIKTGYAQIIYAKT
jgi:hypothetical protein